MGYSLDIAAIGWWLLGCGSMLLLSLLLLVSFLWRVSGADHIARVLREALKHAAEAKLPHGAKRLRESRKARARPMSPWPRENEFVTRTVKIEGNPTPEQVAAMGDVLKTSGRRPPA